MGSFSPKNVARLTVSLRQYPHNLELGIDRPSSLEEARNCRNDVSTSSY